MTEYPAALERRRTLFDGRPVLIRPVRPDDEAAERAFFERLSSETRRLRFMKFVRSVNERLIHSFTHVDYESRMAFVCEATVGEQQRIVGEARYAAIQGGRSCDFGIVIADDWHKSGIAGLLMEALIRHARAHGLETMESLVYRDNRPMLRFVKALGFQVYPIAGEPTTVQVVKLLASATVR
jgi:acetyltransferase